MPQITLNGAELHYDEIGSGNEPIIFCPGDYNIFRNLYPENYHVYGLGLRGHGSSAKVRDNMTYPQFAEDVYSFSKEMGLKKFIFIGISVGGQVGFQFALTHPETLKALIVLKSAPSPRTETWAWPQERRRRVLAVWDDPVAKRAELEAQAIQHIPPEKLNDPNIKEWVKEAVERGMRSTKESWTIPHPGKILPEVKTDEEMAARFGAMKVPVLMVSGGLDHAISPTRALQIALSIPGSKAVFLQEEGHMVLSPQKFMNEITSFIAKL